MPNSGPPQPRRSWEHPLHSAPPRRLPRGYGRHRGRGHVGVVQLRVARSVAIPPAHTAQPSALVRDTSSPRLRRSWSAEASEEPETHRRPCHRPRRILASPTNGCDGREYKQPGGRATTCRDVPPRPQCITAPITRARHPVRQRRLHLQTVTATAAILALLFIARCRMLGTADIPPEQKRETTPMTEGIICCSRMSWEVHRPTERSSRSANVTRPPSVGRCREPAAAPRRPRRTANRESLRADVTSAADPPSVSILNGV